LIEGELDIANIFKMKKPGFQDKSKGGVSLGGLKN